MNAISEQMFIDLARNSYSHFLQARAFAGIFRQSTLRIKPARARRPVKLLTVSDLKQKVTKWK